LARRIAEALGGTLTMTSRSGVGSVFTLHLAPAHETAEVHKEETAARSSQNEG